MVGNVSKDKNEKHSNQFFNNLIDGLITLDDLSTLLKVPKKTIYGWIYRNKIKPIKIGGLIRFNKEYVTQWIVEQQLGDS